MTRGIENILFTSFIGLVVVVALLYLAGLAGKSFHSNPLVGKHRHRIDGDSTGFRSQGLAGDRLKAARPTFEVEALEHQGRWGSLEIWAWLWGLFLAIHLIGMPIALPLFVFLYTKLYGGSWTGAVI